jgi:hypothetical protein
VSGVASTGVWCAWLAAARLAAARLAGGGGACLAAAARAWRRRQVLIVKKKYFFFQKSIKIEDDCKLQSLFFSVFDDKNKL